VTRIRLGLRENLPQFSLLVAVNVLVGAMVGLERSSLPLIGRDEFDVASSAAVLSFIVAFGLAKSFTNLGAGALAEHVGRRRLLLLGWALALPVPLLIALAPSWGWIVAANVFLGVNQGLTWSMTVVMKIDLVGPKQRGFALGVNEAAGYGGVAAAAALSGLLASEFAPRDVLIVAALVVAALGLLTSLLFVRDTAAQWPSSRCAITPTRTPSRRRSVGRFRTPPIASLRFALARKPAWSTTSATPWPGAWFRSTSPPAGPAPLRSD